MNWRIVSALVKKEMFQIVRDPSSILIAFILPVILLFLFGFGINFDTNTVKIGIIIGDKTPETIEILDTIRHSRFLDVKVFNSRKEAEYAMLAGKIRGFAIIPNDFTKKLKSKTKKPTGQNAASRVYTYPEIQVITDGSEPNTAKFVSSYIQGALGVYGAINIQKSPKSIRGGSGIQVIERFW